LDVYTSDEGGGWGRRRSFSFLYFLSFILFFFLWLKIIIVQMYKEMMLDFDSIFKQ
jgi:hypothetical protein